MTVLLLLAAAVSGCRLPGHEGPVSKTLATCRQYSQQGVAAIEAGQWEQAETLLARAVETCPEDSEARRHYAEALWHRGSQREAVRQLDQAAILAGEDAELHVRIAQMRLALGQVNLARRHAERAVDLDPKTSATWAIRGCVLRAAGHPRRALADYHRALVYAPEDRVILLATAQLYRELHQPQQALSMLHTLVDTHSPGEEPPEVVHLQGLICSELGRHDDAAEAFAAAARRGYRADVARRGD